MNINATFLGQMIAMAVFLWFCSKYVWPPFMAIMEERKKKIADGLEAAARAEKDLELRGPGEVLGTRQTGDMQFRIADLQRDSDLLTRVRQLAGQMADYPHQSQQLVWRWLGRGEEYGNV